LRQFYNACLENLQILKTVVLEIQIALGHCSGTRQCVAGKAKGTETSCSADSDCLGHCSNNSCVDGLAQPDKLLAREIKIVCIIKLRGGLDANGNPTGLDSCSNVMGAALTNAKLTDNCNHNECDIGVLYKSWWKRLRWRMRTGQEPKETVSIQNVYLANQEDQLAVMFAD